MSEETEALVEAALFISSEPLDLRSLKKLTDADESGVREALENLRKKYLEDGRGVELFKSPQGYEFRVKPDYLEKVSHLTPYSDLTRGQLKVLALVAFRGPIKQSTIVKIIGNRAYSYIKDLERKMLIHSEKHKRTKKLEITQEFKNYFGIQEKEELEEKLRKALGREEAEELKEK